MGLSKDVAWVSRLTQAPLRDRMQMTAAPCSSHGRSHLQLAKPPGFSLSSFL